MTELRERAVDSAKVLAAESDVERAERRRQEKAKQAPRVSIPSDEAFAKELKEAEERFKAAHKVKCIPSEDADRLMRDEKVKDLLSEMDLPDRHAAKAWTDLDYTTEWGIKLTIIKEKLGKGFLAALIGTYGNGKTQFGVEVLRDAARRLMSGWFVTATDFFMDVKAVYKDKTSDAEKHVVARYRKPQVLVVDEMGKRGETEWENRLLFHLINKRYMDGSDTLLIANQEAEQFEASAGPALVRRMTETGGLIECTWKAFV